MDTVPADRDTTRAPTMTLGAWRRHRGVTDAAARAGLRDVLARFDGPAMLRVADAEAHQPGTAELVQRTRDIGTYIAGGGRLDVAAGLLDDVAATLRRP